MSYKAKDGSYVYEPGDEIPFQHVSQGDEYDARVRVIASLDAADKRKARQEEADRLDRISFAESDRLIREKKKAEYEEAQKKKTSFDNVSKYGVDINFRDPQTSSERRARANYWRTNKSTWGLFLDKVSGKSQKFDKLWDQFSKAETEEERMEIADKMERLYPTTERKIRGVEEGRSR